jgi:glycosyltransferase involved in cell wall biosynthesis
MEREVGDRIDWDRVHFLGRVPYASYCSLIQISRCHVYLTAPFVLSWSLLEAMSMGATIVASDVPRCARCWNTARPGFWWISSTPPLARQVADVLANPADHADSAGCRRHVVETYDFHTRALPTHVARINDLVAPCHVTVMG